MEQGGKVTRVAMITLFDGDRGLLFNQGSFVVAPAEFFKKYDTKDLAPPVKAFDPKNDFKMEINEWVGMPKPALAPAKVEAKPEPAAAEAEAPAAAAPEAPAAAPEAPAAPEPAPEPKTAPAMTKDDAPKVKKTRGRVK